MELGWRDGQEHLSMEEKSHQLQGKPQSQARSTPWGLVSARISLIKEEREGNDKEASDTLRLKRVKSKKLRK